MANRVPLIVNTSSNQIQELPNGDNLDLTGSGIHNAGVITATSFSGSVVGSGNVVSGIITATRIDLNGDIDVDGHTNLDNVSVAGVSTLTGNVTIQSDVKFANQSIDNAVNWSKVANILQVRQSTKLTLGNNNDLQLQHNGSDSVISQSAAGTGALKIFSGGAQSIECVQAGAVNIAHNGDTKLTTTNTGVSISGNVTAVDGTFSGNVSIGGTLTYEDVTNVDAVGLVTARTGVISPYADIDDWVDVGNNIQLGNAGVVTATTFVGDGDFVELDVDGHTNLDNVSVAGVSTFASTVDINGDATFGASGSITASANFSLSSNKLRVTGTDTVGIECQRAGNATIQCTDTTNTTDLQLRANSDGGLVRTATNFPLILGTAQEERLRIHQSNAFVTVNHGNAEANSALILSKTDAGYAKLEFDVGTSQKAYVELDGSENLVHYGAAGVDQLFYAGGSNRLTIDSGGDITIGATLDVGRLDCNGLLHVEYGNATNTNYMASLSNNNGIMHLFRGDGLYIGNNMNTSNQASGPNNKAITLGTNGAVTASGTVTAGSLVINGSAVQNHNSSDTNHTDNSLPAAASGFYVRNGNGTTGTFTSIGLIASSTGASSDQSCSLLAKCTASGLSPEVYLTQRNGSNSQRNTVAINTLGDITLIGNVTPSSDNTQNLGSGSKRWANIYTGDLNLSNEGSTNSVDGTWGSYTIEEGENDLFLHNKRTGKKYKFNLTEV